MDWLRIGAFALLILYHIGMVFAPWHWVVKAPVTYPQLIAPMALLTPWRLALLFAVSGYASRRLLLRSAGTRGFIASRNARLLVPLAFGMTVLVPIEMWVRVRAGGYAFDYLTFWTRDYWRIGSFEGVTFPSWEHLWFVVYLWAYTMLLGAALSVAPARAERAADTLAAWLAERGRLLWAPIAALVTLKLALMFVVAERQGLFSDWGGHAEYLPFFAFGLVLGGTERLWPALARSFRGALATTALAGAIIVPIELHWPGDAVPPHALMGLERAARLAMAWGVTLALFHIAQSHLDRDHRWRRRLAEAVFPAYLLHHPVIVVVAWWILPLAFSPWTAFAILLGAVVLVCASGYALGKRIAWIGRLIGLAGAAVPPHSGARIVSEPLP